MRPTSYTVGLFVALELSDEASTNILVFTDIRVQLTQANLCGYNVTKQPINQVFRNTVTFQMGTNITEAKFKHLCGPFFPPFFFFSAVSTERLSDCMGQTEHEEPQSQV